MTDQTDLIRNIISAERTVPVGDDVVKLTAPDIEAAKVVRRFTMSLRDNDDDEALAVAGLETAAHAVDACIAEIDLETATRLVLATGGEFGELAGAALDLCGLGSVMTKALAAGEADRPT